MNEQNTLIRPNSFREWLRQGEINEMAPAIQPEKSSLKYVIWASSDNASHGPRIKVYETAAGRGRNFSVSISNNPKIVAGKSFASDKELRQIFDFIIENLDNLIGYWNSELSSTEFAENILKFKKK